MISKIMEKQAELYYAAIKEMSGVDPLWESRKREVVITRIMLAYILLQEGWTCTSVGEFLRKNHSTILYYRETMVDFLSSSGYRNEKELWERFKAKCRTIHR